MPTWQLSRTHPILAMHFHLLTNRKGLATRGCRRHIQSRNRRRRRRRRRTKKLEDILAPRVGVGEVRVWKV